MYDILHIARYLRVNPQYIDKLIAAKKLPARKIKLNGVTKWVSTRAQIEDYLAKFNGGSLPFVLELDKI